MAGLRPGEKNEARAHKNLSWVRKKVQLPQSPAGDASGGADKQSMHIMNALQAGLPGPGVPWCRNFLSQK